MAGVDFESIRAAGQAGREDALGILDNYNNRKAALQAGNAYAGGDTTGAAGILARNGQIDTARTLNQDAAEQAAAAKKAKDEQAAHAVTAMVNMAQGLKQVPAEKRSEAFQRIIAPLLQQQGVSPQQIQQMGQSDFSDQTLDTTIAALGQEGKKYQLANGGDGYLAAFDPSSGKLNTLREAQPQYQPVTVEDANGNKAVIPFNKANPYGVGAPASSSPQAVQGANGGSQGGTRADRNNNPGNLKWDGRSNWQGMTGVDPQGFVIFDTPDNGVRAAGINLQTQASRGPQTLTSLISKYAPPTDGNDTQGYIASVAQQTGIDPNAQIDLTDPNIRQKVMTAMFKVEGGGTPARVPAGEQAPSGGMAPIYTTPGFGKQTTGSQFRPATAAEKAAMNLPPDAPGQIDTKTGEFKIPANSPTFTARQDKEQRRTEAADLQIRQANNVINKVDEAMKNVGFGETGLVGKQMSGIAGTKAYTLAKQIDTIKANLAFDQLSAMRAASPTGGALGAVSERELALLESAVSSLDQGLGETELRKNLNDIKTHYTNYIKAIQQSENAPQSAPANSAQRPSLDDIFK